MAQGITDPIQYSPLVLAYMGDAYYELFIRNMLVDQANEQVEKLHKKTISYVKASAQAAIIDHYIDAEMLTEEEMALERQQRPAPPPRHTSSSGKRQIRYKSSSD